MNTVANRTGTASAWANIKINIYTYKNTTQFSSEVCMNCKMLQQTSKGDSDTLSSNGDFERF